MAFFFFERLFFFGLVRVYIIINNSRRLCLYPPWKLIYSWYPKQQFLNGCLVKQKFYVMIWNHPMETTIYKQMFQVPGWNLMVGSDEWSLFKGSPLQGTMLVFPGATTCRAHVCTQPNSQAIPGDGGREGSFGRGGKTVFRSVLGGETAFFWATRP